MGAPDPTPTFSVVVEPLPVEPRTDPPPKIERGPDGVPLGRPGGPLPPPPTQDLPFDRIKPHAIYTPLPASKEIDPERAKLAAPLEIGFCISPMGKTESIEVTASTRDLILDRLVRSSLKKWRFRPLQLHGRAAWACTHVRFRFVP